jgi:CRP/FNR family cyclic AMP-dependent transcriptional regulator
MKIDRITYDKHRRFFKPDSVIFREGEEGTEMYLIVQGSVEIRKATGPSTSKTLTTLGKGDIFGEMAIIDRKPRSATAMATEPTQLLAINEKLYEQMVAANPDFARRMNRILSDRVRRANQIIQSLSVNSRQNQLWSGLVDYAREHGISGYKGFRVKTSDFVQWALEHLGMSAHDVEAILEVFLRRHIVGYSARGKDEILVEPKEALALPES